MLGRNELCPCGSGKKYKKCCLNKDTSVEISSRKVVSSQKQYSELYTKIYEYSRQDKFKEELEKAKEMFYIVDDGEINSKFERFFNTYFIQDHIMEDKKVMTVSFYEENRNNINMSEFNVLKSLFESYVSIYDVKEKLDGKVLLKDCLTGKEVYTEDVKLLSGFEVGNSLIARSVDVEGTIILIDITISISNAIRDIIVADINNLFKQYEDLYKDMSTFLIHHTHILYKYMQQLLDTNVAEHLKNQKAEKEQASAEIAMTEDDCNVSLMLKQNVEAEYLEKCINFWNEYKEVNQQIKGSENGWAAAVEYHIKKENGQIITQAQISKKYEISPSTLGKRYKDLKV